MGDRAAAAVNDDVLRDEAEGVCLGDVVYLEAKRAGFFQPLSVLSTSSRERVGVRSVQCDVSEEFVDDRFVVFMFQFMPPLSTAVVDRADRDAVVLMKAAEEATVRSSLGQPLVYGQMIRLKQYWANRFLSVSSSIDRTSGEPEVVVVDDDEMERESVQWQVFPSSGSRQLGDAVECGDGVLLMHAKFRKFLHCATSETGAQVVSCIGPTGDALRHSPWTVQKHCAFHRASLLQSQGVYLLRHVNSGRILFRDIRLPMTSDAEEAGGSGDGGGAPESSELPGAASSQQVQLSTSNASSPIGEWVYFYGSKERFLLGGSLSWGQDVCLFRKEPEGLLSLTSSVAPDMFLDRALAAAPRAEYLSRYPARLPFSSLTLVQIGVAFVRIFGVDEPLAFQDITALFRSVFFPEQPVAGRDVRTVGIVTHLLQCPELREWRSRSGNGRVRILFGYFQALEVDARTQAPFAMVVREIADNEPIALTSLLPLSRLDGNDMYIPLENAVLSVSRAQLVVQSETGNGEVLDCTDGVMAMLRHAGSGVSTVSSLQVLAAHVELLPCFDAKRAAFGARALRSCSLVLAYSLQYRDAPAVVAVQHYARVVSPESSEVQRLCVRIPLFDGVLRDTCSCVPLARPPKPFKAAFRQLHSATTHTAGALVPTFVSLHGSSLVHAWVSLASCLQAFRVESAFAIPPAADLGGAPGRAAVDVAAELRAASKGVGLLHFASAGTDWRLLLGKSCNLIEAREAPLTRLVVSLHIDGFVALSLLDATSTRTTLPSLDTSYFAWIARRFAMNRPSRAIVTLEVRQLLVDGRDMTAPFLRALGIAPGGAKTLAGARPLLGVSIELDALVQWLKRCVPGRGVDNVNIVRLAYVINSNVHVRTWAVRSAPANMAIQIPYNGDVSVHPSKAALFFSKAEAHSQSGRRIDVTASLNALLSGDTRSLTLHFDTTPLASCLQGVATPVEDAVVSASCTVVVAGASSVSCEFDGVRLRSVTMPSASSLPSSLRDDQRPTEVVPLFGPARRVYPFPLDTRWHLVPSNADGVSTPVEAQVPFYVRHTQSGQYLTMDAKTGMLAVTESSSLDDVWTAECLPVEPVYVQYQAVFHLDVISSCVRGLLPSPPTSRLSRSLSASQLESNNALFDTAHATHLENLIEIKDRLAQLIDSVSRAPQASRSSMQQAYWTIAQSGKYTSTFARWPKLKKANNLFEILLLLATSVDLGPPSAPSAAPAAPADAAQGVPPAAPLDAQAQATPQGRLASQQQLAQPPQATPARAQQAQQPSTLAGTPAPASSVAGAGGAATASASVSASASATAAAAATAAATTAAAAAAAASADSETASRTRDREERALKEILALTLTLYRWLMTANAHTSMLVFRTRSSIMEALSLRPSDILFELRSDLQDLIANEYAWCYFYVLRQCFAFSPEIASLVYEKATLVPVESSIVADGSSSGAAAGASSSSSAASPSATSVAPVVVNLLRVASESIALRTDVLKLLCAPLHVLSADLWASVRSSAAVPKVLASIQRQLNVALGETFALGHRYVAAKQAANAPVAPPVEVYFAERDARQPRTEAFVVASLCSQEGSGAPSVLGGTSSPQLRLTGRLLSGTQLQQQLRQRQRRVTGALLSTYFGVHKWTIRLYRLMCARSQLLNVPRVQSLLPLPAIVRLLRDRSSSHPRFLKFKCDIVDLVREVYVPRFHAVGVSIDSMAFFGGGGGGGGGGGDDGREAQGDAGKLIDSLDDGTRALFDFVSDAVLQTREGPPVGGASFAFAVLVSTLRLYGDILVYNYIIDVREALVVRHLHLLQRMLAWTPEDCVRTSQQRHVVVSARTARKELNRLTESVLRIFELVETQLLKSRLAFLYGEFVTAKKQQLLALKGALRGGAKQAAGRSLVKETPLLVGSKTAALTKRQRGGGVGGGSGGGGPDDASIGDAVQGTLDSEPLHSSTLAHILGNWDDTFCALVSARRSRGVERAVVHLLIKRVDWLSTTLERFSSQIVIVGRELVARFRLAPQLVEQLNKCGFELRDSGLTEIGPLQQQLILFLFVHESKQVQEDAVAGRPVAKPLRAAQDRLLEFAGLSVVLGLISKEIDLLAQWELAGEAESRVQLLRRSLSVSFLLLRYLCSENSSAQLALASSAHSIRSSSEGGQVRSLTTARRYELRVSAETLQLVLQNRVSATQIAASQLESVCRLLLELDDLEIKALFASVLAQACVVERVPVPGNQRIVSAALWGKFAEIAATTWPERFADVHAELDAALLGGEVSSRLQFMERFTEALQASFIDESRTLYHPNAHPALSFAKVVQWICYQPYDSFSNTYVLGSASKVSSEPSSKQRECRERKIEVFQDTDNTKGPFWRFVTKVCLQQKDGTDASTTLLSMSNAEVFKQLLVKIGWLFDNILVENMIVVQVRFLRNAVLPALDALLRFVLLPDVLAAESRKHAEWFQSVGGEENQLELRLWDRYPHLALLWKVEAELAHIGVQLNNLMRQVAFRDLHDALMETYTKLRGLSLHRYEFIARLPEPHHLSDVADATGSDVMAASRNVAQEFGSYQMFVRKSLQFAENELNGQLTRSFVEYSETAQRGIVRQLSVANAGDTELLLSILQAMRRLLVDARARSPSDLHDMQTLLLRIGLADNLLQSITVPAIRKQVVELLLLLFEGLNADMQRKLVVNVFSGVSPIFDVFARTFSQMRSVGLAWWAKTRQELGSDVRPLSEYQEEVDLMLRLIKRMLLPVRFRRQLQALLRASVSGQNSLLRSLILLLDSRVPTTFPEITRTSSERIVNEYKLVARVVRAIRACVRGPSVENQREVLQYGSIVLRTLVGAKTNLERAIEKKKSDKLLQLLIKNTVMERKAQSLALLLVEDLVQGPMMPVHLRLIHERFGQFVNFAEKLDSFGALFTRLRRLKDVQLQLEEEAMRFYVVQGYIRLTLPREVVNRAYPASKYESIYAGRLGMIESQNDDVFEVLLFPRPLDRKYLDRSIDMQIEERLQTVNPSERNEALMHSCVTVYRQLKHLHRLRENWVFAATLLSSPVVILLLRIAMAIIVIGANALVIQRSFVSAAVTTSDTFVVAAIIVLFLALCRLLGNVARDGWLEVISDMQDFALFWRIYLRRSKAGKERLAALHDQLEANYIYTEQIPRFLPLAHNHTRRLLYAFFWLRTTFLQWAVLVFAGACFQSPAWFAVLLLNFILIAQFISLTSVRKAGVRLFILVVATVFIAYIFSVLGFVFYTEVIVFHPAIAGSARICTNQFQCLLYFLTVLSDSTSFLSNQFRFSFGSNGAGFVAFLFTFLYFVFAALIIITLYVATLVDRVQRVRELGDCMERVAGGKQPRSYNLDYVLFHYYVVEKFNRKPTSLSALESRILKLWRARDPSFFPKRPNPWLREQSERDGGAARTLQGAPAKSAAARSAEQLNEEAANAGVTITRTALVVHSLLSLPDKFVHVFRRLGGTNGRPSRPVSRSSSFSRRSNFE